MYLIDGQRRPHLRLAISGTYSTGKSTTTEALSLATGIPRTHAMTARQLLMDIAPGKTLNELNTIELLQLGLRRFEERIQNESASDSFVSDGSVVHEWVYGTARLQVGINPGANWPSRVMKSLAGIGRKAPVREYTQIFGDIVKERAHTLYDAYVHLPVEFPMRADGHRPVSESFRKLSDQSLLDVIRGLGVPYEVVGGSVHERIDKIIELFDLDIVMPIDQAIEEAHRRVGTTIKVIESDARYKAAQRKKSVGDRVKNAMRY
ncbi:AAA family ATPase [Nocardia vulneris]|uniref:ATP-binding protein n=1 Tax=Nocardia vulneris TaxID=1141657 RepID=A0ABR4Z9K8_9NOCA|nr:AAA family ATPase [Nocardia vulneris]KIA62046.1 ATP-binding protein [Nocardia vulneris]